MTRSFAVPSDAHAPSFAKRPNVTKMLKANGAVALTNAFVAACRRNAAGIELTEELL
jgi:hypothetical protein